MGGCSTHTSNMDFRETKEITIKFVFKRDTTFIVKTI